MSDVNVPSQSSAPGEYRPSRRAYRGRVWTKVLFVAGMWLVQTMALVVFVVLLFDGPGDLLDIFVNTPDLEGGLVFAGLGAGILVCQAALVLPVLKPVRREGAGSVWRAVVAGVACAIIGASVGMAAATMLIVAADGTFLEASRPSPILWLFTLLCGLGAGGIGYFKACAHGENVFGSVAICAAACAAMFCVAIAAVVGTLWLYYPEHFELGAGVVPDAVLRLALVGGAILILVSWVIAGILILRFKGGQAPDSFISKLATRIFVGSVIESAAVVPLDVMVRRKTDCYCSDGTFWSLLVCFTIGVIMFGPIVFILPLGRRARRLHMGRCRACGYDMRATLHASRCPECGAGWRGRLAGGGAEAGEGQS